MPIDLEMLLSASNHAFFPYSSYDGTSTYNRNLSFPQNHCVPRSPAKFQGPFNRKFSLGGFTNATSYKPNEKAVAGQEHFNVRKKKVSFADDKGLKLVEVREIPGAPKWADDVITLLIGSTKRSVVKEKKWKIAFEHPPWADDKLIDAIEKNMIALEHITVKEGIDDYLTGTVKCDGKEYWDNNGGINYRLIVEYSKSSVPDLHETDTPTLLHSDPGISFSYDVESAEDAWEKLTKDEGYW